ncbi:hypothetical protein FRC09_004891 [Ceratobasidium sp. 395]|nr:hypothetical protein FRC09_004891 [Ceratobasidium sp. 395]
MLRSNLARSFTGLLPLVSPQGHLANVLLIAVRSKSKLLSPTVVSAPVKKPKTNKTKPLSCWIDATPNRAAILIGDSYRAFTIKDNTDNNFSEAVNFELLAAELRSRNYVGEVIVYSDSKVALRAFEGKKCSLKAVVESSARARDIIKSSQFSFKTVQVTNKRNQADPMSRGRNPLGYRVIDGPARIPEALKKQVYAE